LRPAALALLIAMAAGSAAAQGEPGPVELIFAGDVMLDEGPGRTVETGGDPLADFAGILAAADLAVGNLECPIATLGEPNPNKPYVFRAEPRAIEVLKGRFQALSVANNHSGDWGQAAFLETLDRLAEAGIAPVGGGRNLAEAHRPLRVEQGGLSIAILAYNEFKPRAFEAGPTWPGIAWSEDSQVLADIRAARAAGADLVIPFMHWGWEREPEPSARQRRLARAMIDAGADAVVGAHPHCVQGAELYRGRPIVYSLGNFVFDGFEDERLRTGWLLRLQLDRDGVLAWDTIAARADDSGSPHPIPGALTPCARRGDTQVGLCPNP
jgi:poly-gamma-glutamate synthesis protein (capsule biosynthesis protein)